MFYDMEDPNQFISDSEKFYKGWHFHCAVNVPKNMLDSNDVGNICHEHLEYYSFNSLEYLFNKLAKC